MDKNDLEKIRQAESQAEKMIQEAEKEAASIIEDNKKKARAYEEELQAGMETMSREIMMEHTAKAEAEAGKMQASQLDAYRAAREKAAGRMDQAARHIVERIVDGKWQS